MKALFLGLLTLLGLALALIGPAMWSARVAARALGLRPFRWFDAGPREDRVKRLLVCTVSTASGLLVALGLSVFTHFFEGKSVATLEIKPREGMPAAAAGLRDGDRIVGIGGVRMNTPDDVRAAVSAPGDVKQLEINRQGERKHVDVRPDSGRIGVAFIEQREAFSAGEAIARGLVAPFLGFGEREVRHALEHVRSSGDIETVLRRALSLRTARAGHASPTPAQLLPRDAANRAPTQVRLRIPAPSRERSEPRPHTVRPSPQRSPGTQRSAGGSAGEAQG